MPSAIASRGPFAVPGTGASDYTDGRAPGEWKSDYPPEARRGINFEACVLGSTFFALCLLSGLFLGLLGQPLSLPITWFAKQPGEVPPLAVNVDFRLLAIFSLGCLGGTTFSIKWLVHSAARCKWHLDRRYWRMFVPLLGGVYACVVLTLLDSGVIGTQSAGTPRPVALTTAFAFLVGYFSDGVSGLLSNIANAVFGTLEKK
jgi:hypothetical protein